MSASIPKEAKMTNARWGVFIAILALCTINYFDRAVISLCMPIMAKDLNFSPALIGVILSSFFWGYTLMQIPIGWICDRAHPGKLLVITGIFWGAIQACSGLISTALVLIILRVFLGVAESPMYPSGSKLQSVWLPSTERGRGAALLAAGSDIGIALGGPLVPLALAWLGGWRGALIGAGVLTVVVVLAFYRIMTSDPKTSRRVNETERNYIASALAEEYETSQKIASGKAPAGISGYLTSMNFWVMCIGFYCADALYYGLMTWGPLYLAQTLHMNILNVGGAVFAVFVVAVGGAGCGGYFTDKWRGSGASINSVMHKCLATLGIIAGGALFLLTRATTPTVAIVMLCIAMFCLKWMFCIYWQTPAAVAQRKDVGMVAGSMNFIGNFSGVITPIVVGLIVGATGSYFWALVMFVAYGLGAGLFPLFLNYSKKIGS